MSHTINITRRITTTTTVTTGSTMGVNVGYLKTAPGLLILAETLVGAVVVGCTAGSAAKHDYVCLDNRVLYLLAIAIACLITTFLMFVSSLFHEGTAGALQKTLFELLYHCFACLMYLAGAIAVMVVVNDQYYHGSRYTELLVGSIFALVNAILYLASAILSYKGFK